MPVFKFAGRLIALGAVMLAFPAAASGQATPHAGGGGPEHAGHEASQLA